MGHTSPSIFWILRAIPPVPGHPLVGSISYCWFGKPKGLWLLLGPKRNGAIRGQILVGLPQGLGDFLKRRIPGSTA